MSEQRVQLAAAVAADGDQRQLAHVLAELQRPGVAQHRVDERARACTSVSTDSSARKRCLSRLSPS